MKSMNEKSWALTDLLGHELLPCQQVVSVAWPLKAVACVPLLPCRLSQEEICPVTSGIGLKVVWIMELAMLAHLSLFRDENASHCYGQQDTVHC